MCAWEFMWRSEDSCQELLFSLYKLSSICKLSGLGCAISQALLAYFFVAWELRMFHSIFGAWKKNEASCFKLQTKWILMFYWVRAMFISFVLSTFELYYQTQELDSSSIDDMACKA